MMNNNLLNCNPEWLVFSRKMKNLKIYLKKYGV